MRIATKTATKPKLVKLNAAGRRVSAKATEFAAVLDTETGLIAAVGTCPKAMTYADAEAHVAELNAKRYAGRANWRLPSVPEMVGRVDYTRYSPAMDTDFYPDARSSWYWTSTPCADAASFVFVVDFSLGDVDGYARHHEAFCRPVASASQ
jgi:hypothetical protein